jgi:hypothetical protein
MTAFVAPTRHIARALKTSTGVPARTQRACRPHAEGAGGSLRRDDDCRRLTSAGGALCCPHRVHFICCSSVVPSRSRLNRSQRVMREVSVDQERFDRLAVTLARGAHRRTLLQLLSGALIGAGLRAAPEVDGQGKRQDKGKGKGKSPRTKRRQQQRDKRKGKQTTSEACPLCKRRNSRGRCVPDRSVDGKCCANGTCLNGFCFPGPCSGPICNDQTCADGCCDAQGSCHVDDDNACGTGGGSCTSCTALGTTCGGGGIPGQCGACSADNCAEGCCDGGTCRVGDAAACGTDGGTCVDCRAVDFCDPGPCPGVVCVSPCDCVAGRGCCLAAGNRPPDAGALGCLAFCCAGVCTGPADDLACA